jgi:hypothetical protein
MNLFGLIKNKDEFLKIFKKLDSKEKDLIYRGMQVPIYFEGEKPKGEFVKLGDKLKEGGYLTIQKTFPFFTDYQKNCKYLIKIGELNPDYIIDSFKLDYNLFGKKIIGLPVKKI